MSKKLRKRLRKLSKRLEALEEIVSAWEADPEAPPESPYSYFVQYEPVERVLKGHEPLDLAWNETVDVIPIGDDEWGAGTYL